QKGKTAPSVPGIGLPVAESKDRNSKVDFPCWPAMNATRLPSGEIANESGSVVGGVVISRRTSGGGVAGRKASAPITTVVSVAKATVAHASFSLRPKALLA